MVRDKGRKKPLSTEGSHPIEDQVHLVKSTEMDIFTAVEAGVQLPIAFRNKFALEAWADENQLRVGPIGKRRKAHIVRGQISVWGQPEGLDYAQIWVAVEYRAYRDAMKAHISQQEGSEKDIQRYDCDHAVSRARLKEVWPDGWVSLILVKRSLNRAIGAMMEKSPLHVGAEQDRLDLDAEAVLKALYTRGGKLQARELAQYLRVCRARFLTLPSADVAPTEAMSGVQLFFMAERADAFFARLAERHGIEAAAVLPKKKFAVLQIS